MTEWLLFCVTADIYFDPGWWCQNGLASFTQAHLIDKFILHLGQNYSRLYYYISLYYSSDIDR
jgi:hypothetical protein